MESKNLGDIFNVMGYAQKQFDVFDKFNVTEYLTALGLCVHPTYTGRGIATEMLKARVPLLKALGLKTTSTSFTGVGSQIAARKAGYQENFVIS